MKRLTRHFCFLLLLLLAGHASGAVLTLESGNGEVDAGAFQSWMVDTGKLSPARALQQLLNGRGQEAGTNFPSLGFTRDSYWFLLSINNRSDQIEWYMQAGRPTTDKLDVYLFNDAGDLVRQWRAGDARPFSVRAFPHQQMMFDLPLAPGHNHVLMHVSSTSVLDMPVTLFTPSTFQQVDSLRMYWFGFFFGGAAILCLYNLLIFLSIRDRSYLFYVLYLSVFSMIYLSSEGMAMRWLWPDAPWWNNVALSMLRYATLAFSVYFTCEFLRLSHFYPRVNRLLHYFAAAMLLLGLLCLPFFAPLQILSTLLILPWPAIAIVIATLVLLRGYVPARYFLLAFIMLGAAITAYMLKSLNLIPSSWGMEFAIQACILLEALLLSFALAHRMTVLRDENARIQQKSQAELEDKVRERTRELNDALSARSQFLAVMSHEIRTPLNGILGTLDLLKTARQETEQRRYIDIIESSGNNLLHLIDDILDYTRIEAGKMPINEETFSIATLAQECCALFENKALVGGNQLQLHLHQNLGAKAKGDSLRIRQLLDNLISNAIKFTSDGTIDIHIKREDSNPDYVLFLIHDTGIGIAEDKLSQLFELFQQADSSTSRQFGGTGLGLAVCQQLVEVMGGEIGVQSKPGQGSTFWFHLPLPPASASPIPAPARLPNGRSGRLLIVDDNNVNLMVAAGLCKKLGHTVETCESGAEAIATLLSDSRGFDLVLMDCEMPVMDGFAATREILRLEEEGRLPHTPVVALTAHAVPDKIRACQEAGMVMHIAKPLNLEKLNFNLSKLLNGG